MTLPGRSDASPRVFSRRPLPGAAPADAVYVGRPSVFGNPFAIGVDGDRATVIARYEAWIVAPEQAELLARARRELRGRDLVCWCAPLPCHADVLLRLCNEILVGEAIASEPGSDASGADGSSRGSRAASPAGWVAFTGPACAERRGPAAS